MSAKRKPKKNPNAKYIAKRKGYTTQGIESKTRMVRLDFNFCNWIVAAAKKRRKPGEWTTAVELSRKLYENREMIERYFDR